MSLPSVISGKPGNIEGLLRTQPKPQTGVSGKRDVSVGSGSEPLAPKGKDHSVSLQSSLPRVDKPLHRRTAAMVDLPKIPKESSKPEGSGSVFALSGKGPHKFDRDTISLALQKVGGDPRLDKLKNDQKPNTWYGKIAEYFTSGNFLKLVPKAISGPIWSMIQADKAERHSERMLHISEDAGSGRLGKSGEQEMTLPHELAGALAGHYQAKAEKASDAAMVSAVSMVASPILGPILSPLGQIASKGLETGVTMGAKFAVKKGVTEPGRDQEKLQTDGHKQGSRIDLGGGESANSARAARAFLKYLAEPPRQNMLKSSDPQVREREEARLYLKASMAANIKTDYNKEVRTERDQLEKMGSENSSRLRSSDSSPFVGGGVGWDGQHSNDYLRRMMVCEGMIEHSLESLSAKDRQI